MEGLIVTFFGNSGKKANSKVAVDIDTEKFWDIIEEGIKEYCAE